MHTCQSNCIGVMLTASASCVLRDAPLRGAPQDDENLYVATIPYRHPEEARSAVSKDASRPVRDSGGPRQAVENSPFPEICAGRSAKGAVQGVSGTSPALDSRLRGNDE